MVLDSREAVLGYARRFVEAGCPVILLKASNDPSGEFRFPSGWDSATPGQAWADVEAGFESGQDALALVSGWGVDGADFDAKLAGAVDTFGERGLAFLALHRTPSGGLHYIVPATGMASRNGVDFDGRPFGDWRGGTDSGGGRGLLFLPGSTRPKYPGGEYTVEVEFTGLPEDAEPDDGLYTLLLDAGCNTAAEGGRSAVSAAEAQAFLANCGAAPTSRCPYGVKTVDALVEQMTQATEGRRHATLNKTMRRLVELMLDGCAYREDFDRLATVFRERKPEASGMPLSVLRSAIPNVDGFTGCAEHGGYTDRFWGSRGGLRWIQDTAHAKVMAPEGLLGATLVHVAAEIGTGVRVDSGVKDPSALNLYGVLFGTSGSGKTTAADAVRTARGWEHTGPRNIGTVQGMAAAFRERTYDQKSKQWRDVQCAESVLFYEDEGEALLGQEKAFGGIIAGLSRMWNGGHWEPAYKSQDARIKLPRDSYRIGLLIDLQPDKLSFVLNERGSGFYERLLWFATTDEDFYPVETQQADMPFGLRDEFRHGEGPKLLGVSPGIRGAARRHALDSTRGQVSGHDFVLQLRVAAVLAVWDGAELVRDSDWALAGVIVRRSRAVSEQATREYLAQRHKSEAARGRADAARDAARAEALAENAERLIRTAVRKAVQGQGPVRKRDVKKNRTATHNGTRQAFDTVVAQMCREGLVAEVRMGGQKGVFLEWVG